jgi:pimeloyl-ACP methyl ester carboxylesterase
MFHNPACACSQYVSGHADNTQDSTIMKTSINYTTDFVTSKDGTKIGYRQIGKGEGLILVHGGMMYSQNFMKLAELLADKFTIYIPDRRGRGLSGPPGDNYSLIAESLDLQALIKKTETQNVFGLSSGAIIVLQTSIIEPSIQKIALYEPPIPVNGTNPAKWLGDYEQAMAERNFGKAMISIVRGTGDTSLMGRLPNFLTIPFMNFAVKADAKDKETNSKNEVPLETLISNMRYDAKAVIESEGIIDRSKNITANVLLLGGQRSQLYLKTALDVLSSTFPNAKRVEFHGQGHLAADNSGKPEVVAKELQSFFRTT